MSKTVGELSYLENIRAEFESAKARNDGEVVYAIIRALRKGGFVELAEEYYNDYFKGHGETEAGRS